VVEPSPHDTMFKGSNPATNIIVKTNYGRSFDSLTPHILLNINKYHTLKSIIRVVTQEQSNRDPKLESFNATATGTKREKIALKFVISFMNSPRVYLDRCVSVITASNTNTPRSIFLSLQEGISSSSVVEPSAHDTMFKASNPATDIIVKTNHGRSFDSHTPHILPNSNEYHTLKSMVRVVKQEQSNHDPKVRRF
jgi:hypothetical protein